MRIGKASIGGQDLRLSAFAGADLKKRINADGLGFLTIEMTWDEWDILVKDAEHLRETGEFRG